MDRRRFFSMMLGAAGSQLIPWRLPERVIVLPTTLVGEVSAEELIAIMQRAFVTPMVVQLYKRSPLIAALLAPQLNR